MADTMKAPRGRREASPRRPIARRRRHQMLGQALSSRRLKAARRWHDIFICNRSRISDVAHELKWPPLIRRTMAKLILAAMTRFSPKPFGMRISVNQRSLMIFGPGRAACHPARR